MGDLGCMMKLIKTLIEWRQEEFNTYLPHSWLDCRPPTPEVILPRPCMPPYVLARNTSMGQATIFPIEFLACN